MEKELLAHVGTNIRLYRRIRAMTLEDLARSIHKSRASVSKYEAGQVSIDLETLYDIARALRVAPVQLFDCVPQSAENTQPISRHMFLQSDTYYMYNLYDGEVFFSLMKLFYNESSRKTEATLFYKLEDTDPIDCSRCDCVYRGTMLHQDFVLSFLMQNLNDARESALMNLRLPMNNVSAVTGMLCGLEFRSCEPVALKVLLSRSRLPVNAALIDSLAFTPQSFKELRQKNKLFIRDG